MLSDTQSSKNDTMNPKSGAKLRLFSLRTKFLGVFFHFNASGARKRKDFHLFFVLLHISK